jgi:hypothetical protein
MHIPAGDISHLAAKFVDMLAYLCKDIEKTSHSMRDPSRS